jgi:hypothetical protein
MQPQADTGRNVAPALTPNAVHETQRVASSDPI